MKYDYINHDHQQTVYTRKEFHECLASKSDVSAIKKKTYPLPGINYEYFISNEDAHVKKYRCVNVKPDPI